MEKDSELGEIEITSSDETLFFSFGFSEKAQDFYLKMMRWLKQFENEMICSRSSMDLEKREMIISVNSKDFNIREIFNFLFQEKQIDESIAAIPDMLNLKSPEETLSNKTSENNNVEVSQATNSLELNNFSAEVTPVENYASLIETIERQIKKFNDGISFFSINKGKKASLIKEALQNTIEAMNNTPALFKSPEDVLNYKKDGNSRSLKQALNYNRLLIQREKTNTLLEVESFLYPKNGK
ncbi:hypothetical protein [Legionella clemsonensis]|uniref:hypothetical protein n=1 Tax=Legionella clemsonensis TaxID=1867846 RepID=UPI0012FE5C27|nr:hypothetical protein [Legionella clemsonensis]